MTAAAAELQPDVRPQMNLTVDLTVDPTVDPPVEPEAPRMPQARNPLRALPIPDTEPAPDATPYSPRTAHRASDRQRTLALALVSVPDEVTGYEDVRFGPRPTSTSDLPDPTAWAGRMVQAVIEALSGVRPVTQLVRWTRGDVYAALQRRCALAVPRAQVGRRAVVRSVRIGQPADGVVEACAVVVSRGRVQAVAMRLEGLDGRWQMTALEMG
jgi:hypothetical protein